MAWRDTRDPYLIWIAEIIFQQTRIQQGLAYYERFVRRFPDVFELAAASQDEVLKYWEGLGYYSRARNLHQAAQYLADHHQGVFPETPEALLSLKGVGPYTARAIASFAFDYPTGVIDGNVLRVMSRVLNDFSPIDQARTRKHYQQLIDDWVAHTDSRSFNHGIMDLGSMICTPTKPGCLLCPLQEGCGARKAGTIPLLPAKSKKLKRKVRYYYFYLVENEAGALAIRQRPEAGLWGGLWEIPNEEVPFDTWQNRTCPYGGQYRQSLKHTFTHFDMMIHVFHLSDRNSPDWEGVQFISKDKISIFAFSKAVLKILATARNS